MPCIKLQTILLCHTMPSAVRLVTESLTIRHKQVSAMAVITEINFYPIKSCKRISLQTADLRDRGILYDRIFMVTREDYSFVTQRQYPYMALIQPSVDTKTQKLVVMSPNQSTALEVPLNLPAKHSYVKVTGRVWKDECDAYDMGDEAAAWFSTALGVPLRLVRMDDKFVRPVQTRPLFDQPKKETNVGFADGAPVLLANAASLNDLASSIDSVPLSMTRFRPNIVIAGVPAWIEDTWARIRINGLEFFGVSHCTRCKMTTIDQDTGTIPDGEPLKSMQRLRASPDYENGVLFGLDLVNSKHGSISVGDKVTVLSVNDGARVIAGALSCSKDNITTAVSAEQAERDAVEAKTRAALQSTKACRRSSGTFCKVLLLGLVINLLLFVAYKMQTPLQHTFH
eukprot:TRINITY_DN7677_c0_g1_i1.p1 TRINITY_DN7677_c0_g1~~TRINITY_DN7677_c0_g1_i1.p1  ORF type:complete len:398 (+),score=91.10 TRINITY_DN7677_c0_g1_i1:128-1321(+)